MRHAWRLAAALAALVPAAAAAQQPAPAAATAAAPPGTVVVRGGWIFTATSDTVVRNRGILVRNGRLMRVNADLAAHDTAGARVLQLADDEYVLPGLVDVHAHYNMTLGEGGTREDEYTWNPIVFLANGVTSTFPSGEYDPEGMMAARRRIDAGVQVGPRLFNSGPYFGTARRGWRQDMTADEIRREVDEWAAKGVRGFKAKGISPEHLQPLIERAHLHGLPVTAHLESGFRNTVNAADAVRMGIDGVEHILGGDALSPTRAAYPSWIVVDTASKAFRDIVRLFIDHRVAFDPTITAPVYFTTLKEGFDYWYDERTLFTPEVQAWVREKRERRYHPMMDSLYWAMRRTTKAFHDAGGTLTLGTDNPSTGEFLAGFSAHRELHTLVLSGIPEAAALRIATINGARALGAGDLLGSVEPGKLADLVVVRGNPLQDIRNTRNVRHVMKSGALYDPAALLQSVVGKIGPVRRAADAR